MSLAPVVVLMPFHNTQLHSVTPEWLFPVLSLQALYGAIIGGTASYHFTVILYVVNTH